jgi:peptidoglycan/xylan/chitin deacetylase (PgdA/CDA1 family)
MVPMTIARLLVVAALVVPSALHAAEPRYRVALVTAGEPLESVAARRALQAMGIPYDVVPPTALAARYPLAILPGPLHNTSLTAAEREAVYGFVSGGGVLVATHVEGSDYFPLFGLSSAAPARDRFRVRFLEGVENGWLRYLDHPKEREISLGDPALFKETIWTVRYGEGQGRPLAAFPDGGAAAVVNDYDAGQALALGMSLAQTVLLAQVGQHYEPGRQFVNSFEPSGDVFLLLLRGLYEATARPAVRWHTVPRGLETAIVLTHDVDARESFAHAVDFARLQARHGVRSTFFVTTKTFADAADIGYYDPTRIPFIAAVRGLGFEVGSHSVSHSRAFARFPMGTDAVTARSYRPGKASTVLGEVKVSKELLDRDLPGQDTVSFRAGELAFPPRLIEALEQTGYRYDSTFSANDIITNFPFFAFDRKQLGARETRLVEIPVTVDDSQGYLTPGTVDRVVQAWTEIIEANRANGATTCILIHPTDATYKLEVMRRLLEHYAPQPIWIGPIADLGDFWTRRAAVGFRVETDGGGVVRLDRPAAALGADLALAIDGDGAWRVLDGHGKAVPVRPVARAGSRLLWLGPPAE